MTIKALPSIRKDLIIEMVQGGPRGLADQFDQLKDKGENKNSEWSGRPLAEAQAGLRNGDNDKAKEVAQFYDKLKDIVPVTNRRKQRMAVAGGAPNIGAIVTGTPLQARRMVKAGSEQGPLAIVVDLVSSAGIKAQHLEQRGAACLALAQMLATVRPVSLYICAAAKASGSRKSAGFIVQVPSSPIDLARAGVLFADIAVARKGLYNLISERLNKPTGSLCWPFGGVDEYREKGAEIWGHALGKKVLFLAPPYLTDDSISAPEKFIRDKMKEYGGL